MNQISVILPYRHEGGWAFDDDATELFREPFIAGADIAIDKIVDQLGIKGDKIKMIFSAGEFPGYDIKLEHDTSDIDLGGDFYRIKQFDRDDGYNNEEEGYMNGDFVCWLCPALLKYFNSAPKEIYVKVEELN